MSVVKFVLAALPILWLLFSLGKLKLAAWKAAGSALMLTILIAILGFSMPAVRIAQASAEGGMLALFPILWVILSALFVYNVLIDTGKIDVIKTMLSGLSPDRRVQALILAFAFGGFLEAVAGFGTAVAIPAGILVAMGFSPMLAAGACLIANTVAVAFGVLGVPVITLAQVSGLPLGEMTRYTALQLIPLGLLVPLVIVFAVTGHVRQIRGVVGLSVISGVSFCAAQTLTAWFVGPELAAVIGSLVCLAVILVYTKLFPVKKPWRFEQESGQPQPPAARVSPAEALKAWSPYLITMALVFAFKFLPFLSFAGRFPFTVKGQFYFGPGGKPMSFALLTSGGSILFISAVLGGLIQGASPKMLLGSLWKTLRQIRTTIPTVLCILALSKIMSYSGMTDAFAKTLAAVSGRFYPLLAPLMGALGTFITGSDTSSNALFGTLQKQTAAQLNMNLTWLTACNASGATIGKMISPQSIAIAASATALSGSEGALLKKTIRYCAVFIVVQGLFVFLVSLFL